MEFELEEESTVTQPSPDWTMLQMLVRDFLNEINQRSTLQKDLFDIFRVKEIKINIHVYHIT